MAVAPTGAIYKALEFDGVSSRTYGVYITGEAVYNAPERDVEMITIPGRSGSFALDNGRFENITVTYPAGIFAETEADFREAISEFRNFLCSRKGYVRLQDEYNPDEYRMAVYKSGLEVEPAMLKAGEFEITFDCKPQRWLTSGETAITIGEWGETETATGDIVKIDNPDGTLGIKSLSVTLEPIQDLHGYDKPWSGGSGANKYDSSIAVDNSRFTTTGTTTVSGLSRSDYIEISPNTSYYIMGVTPNNSGHSGVFWFDENKDFVRADGANGATASTPVDLAVTSPSTAKYVGINMFTTNKDNGAVNYPSTVTSWTPYENICPISGRTEVVTQRTGVNVWDEEWELGYYNNTNGGKTNSSSCIRCKNAITVTPNTVYFFKSANRYSIRFYDADGGYLGRGASANYAGNTQFTTPADCHYVRFYMADAYGTTYNHDISINYPSTDHDYHAYDGETYTTDLGRTVYGGTLDVVSGELVVDRAKSTLDQTYTWSVENGGMRIKTSDLASVIKHNGSNSTLVGAICDKFEERTPNQTWAGGDSGIGFSVAPNGDVAFCQTGEKTMGYSAWITFVTNNPIELVYELATPQTYQLTPQEVELLTGTNNVWSDSGDITLEYGQLPNLLINPTLFESGPLLEVKGYGTIGFNGFEIELNNETFGDVTVLSETIDNQKSFSFTFAKGLYNLGDTIEIKKAVRKWVIVASEYYAPPAYGNHSIGDVSVSDSNLSATTTAEKIDPPGTNRGRHVYSTTFSGLTFTAGTYTTVTDTITASVDIVYWSGGAYVSITTETLAPAITIKYESLSAAEDMITFSFTNVYDLYSSAVSSTMGTSIYGPVIVHSTLSMLGNPTYIDCDIGEAYKIENDSPISLNQYIDLGPKLPTLAPGSNEVTFDNTITDLKVVPRWWKI